MLHIMLLILKIIGIILICILGMVLFAVLCALFVPLRYQIEVMREEGEGKPPVVVRVKVTWLLHLINVLLCYPADVYVRVRIFLFTLFQIPEKQHKPSRRKKAGGSGPEETETSEGGSDPEETEAPEGVGAKSSEQPEEKTEIQDTEENAPPAEKAGGSGAEGTVQREEKEDTRHKILCKIRHLTAKIKAFFQKIQYTICGFCDKIESTLDTIKYYCDILRSDAFARSFALCKEQLGIILRAVRPDRFEADMIVGTNDPASTGEILAVFGMLYPYVGEHVRVVGDFERAHIEGRIFLKGKVRAFTFLCIAVRVYRNKDIRTLIKLFKKEAV